MRASTCVSCFPWGRPPCAHVVRQSAWCAIPSVISPTCVRDSGRILLSAQTDFVRDQGRCAQTRGRITGVVDRGDPRPYPLGIFFRLFGKSQSLSLRVDGANPMDKLRVSSTAQLNAPPTRLRAAHKYVWLAESPPRRFVNGDTTGCSRTARRTRFRCFDLRNELLDKHHRGYWSVWVYGDSQ